jgi:hypothetical protein
VTTETEEVLPYKVMAVWGTILGQGGRSRLTRKRQLTCVKAGSSISALGAFHRIGAAMWWSDWPLFGPFMMIIAIVVCGAVMLWLLLFMVAPWRRGRDARDERDGRDDGR